MRTSGPPDQRSPQKKINSSSYPARVSSFFSQLIRITNIFREAEVIFVWDGMRGRQERNLRIS